MDTLRRLEHRYRVRFDEAGADGRLRPSGLLRYVQDMAWRHSEEAGFDRDWYDARAMAWVVRNVSMSISEQATYGSVLALSTEIVGWRHVWARRRTTVIRIGADGQTVDEQPVASVDTDWVVLTTEGRPARVPEEIARYFSSEQAFTRSRVLLPDPRGDVTTLSTRVRPLDVDPMGHMNNAAYLDHVDDALARMPDLQECGRPDCYRLGYVRPALPGSAVNVACWPTEDGAVACRISDGEGEELSRVLVSWTAA